MSEKRAIAYLRVSIVGDREVKGTLESPKLQRQAITAWADRNGVEIIDEVEDKNASGLKFTRPGLERALEQAASSDAGVLVAYGDRYARNTELGLRLLREAKERGSWIKSADGTVDISTPQAHMATTMFLASWENYAATRRAISKVVHEHAITVKGRQMGPAPFGYIRGDDSRLIVDDPRAKWVRYVFERRADRIGWVAISRELRDAKVKQRNGRALNAHMLRRMVPNPAYVGEAHHGEHVRAGAHPALIDEVLWQAANRVKPAVRSDVSGREHADSLLRGLLRCSGCRYVLKRLPKGDKPPRWRCRTALSGRDCTHECDAPATLTGRQGEKVEAAVIESFLTLAAGVAVEPAARTVKVADLERRVVDAEATLDDLSSSLAVREQLGAERWGRMVAEARKSLDAAAEELARERAQARVRGVDRVTLEAAWEGMTLAERQDALRSIVQAVMVGSDGNIDVVPVWVEADLPRKGAYFVARPWER